MENIFIQNRQHGKLGITSSKGGEIIIDPATGDRFIVLKQGNRYEGVPGQADYKVTKFDEYAVRVAENKEVKLALGFKEMPTEKLFASNEKRAVSELQKRFSLPIALLIFAALAIPISRVSPRAGMYGNLLTALLIYIIYENLMSLSHSWLVKGIVSPWIGVWWVHLCMFVLTVVMLVKSLGYSWVKMQVSSK
jgi:lipopolysaccharide export system permease protein